jgi:ABC-2 type transport system ATP-binding protein
VKPFLGIRQLSHRYGSRQVLKELSFDLTPGEVLGLLGPNGSGKSTALKIIAGTLKRQTGDIQFMGRTLRDADQDFREKLGVVFQHPSLDPKLTARENLHLTGTMRGLPKALLSTRMAEALELAGLVDRGNDIVATFSGGMTRRLDVARAMLHHPTLLLMDEPTAGLDEASFRRMWTVLNRLRKMIQTSVLIATHRPDEAAMCDRLIILNEGETCRIASPDTLIREVAADVIVLECSAPQRVAEQLQDALQLTARWDDHRVFVECEEGPREVLDIVSLIKRDQLKSINIRRPGLSDVFLKLTGFRLDGGKEDAV